MKSSTNPALALLVGTLVLGQMNGPDTAKTSPGPTTARSQAIDPQGIAESISGLINQIRPKAQAAVDDLLKDIKKPSESRAVQPKPQASRQEVAATVPRALPSIRFKPPPPAPHRTPEEMAKIQEQVAMYERIKHTNEMDREADLASGR